MRDLVLGIETSCDDTSVALVDHLGQVHLSLTAGQVAGHLPFGGVVPELASRLHAETLLPMIDQIITQTEGGWARVSHIAVTSRPGLIGSLLVGVVTAKTLALSKRIPLVDVNHIHGHVFSVFLKDEGRGNDSDEFDFPYLCLVVSGGHTHLYHVKSPSHVIRLGQTRDDAAGEAFDKFANLLNLGFPGGPLVDRAAQGGNHKAFSFPRSMIHEDHLEFSFSGLKSAAMRTIESFAKPLSQIDQSDLAASYQEAICEVLIHKLQVAQEKTQCRSVAITGGVSANSRLRALAQSWCKSADLRLRIPPLKYCTDNGAMIAYAGWLKSQAGDSADQNLTPASQSLTEDFHDAHRT